MASQVEIANLALSILGASRITSLTDNNKSARAISANYEILRRAELRKNYWSFAMKRTQLAALTEAPSWGFGTAFGMPTDFIRLVQAGDVYFSPSQSDYNTGDSSLYALETMSDGSPAIVCDLGAPLKIRYVYDVSDPGLFDPLFAVAFAAQLAYTACEEITNSSQKQELAQQRYEQAKLDAIRAGAIERPPVAIADDSWMVARI